MHESHTGSSSSSSCCDTDLDRSSWCRPKESCHKNAPICTKCSKIGGKKQILECQNKIMKTSLKSVNLYIYLHVQRAGWAVGPSDSQRGELPSGKGSHDVFILWLLTPWGGGSCCSVPSQQTNISVEIYKLETKTVGKKYIFMCLMCTFLHFTLKTHYFFYLCFMYVHYVAMATSQRAVCQKFNFLCKADWKVTEYLTMINILTFPYFWYHPPKRFLSESSWDSLVFSQP